MAKAIETGIPKMRIEEAAARRQARIDSGREIIVGVNRYQTGREENLDTREVDNGAVRDSQLRRLAQIRATRDAARRGSSSGGLDRKPPEAAKATCSNWPSRRRAPAPRWAKSRPRSKRSTAATRPSTAPSRASIRRRARAIPEFQKARQLAEEFGKAEGRRPRILVAKMGQDGHDRGAKVIATAFADLGFDVDVGPLFQTPLEAARMAVENDVHVLGVSSLAGGHKTLVPEVIARAAASSAAKTSWSSWAA